MIYKFWSRKFEILCSKTVQFKAKVLVISSASTGVASIDTYKAQKKTAQNLLPLLIHALRYAYPHLPFTFYTAKSSWQDNRTKNNLESEIIIKSIRLDVENQKKIRRNNYSFVGDFGIDVGRFVHANKFKDLIMLKESICIICVKP